MAWNYCDRWNLMLGKPIEPLTEDEARNRHQQGTLYTAYSLRDDGTIVTAVEVRLENGYVGVLDFDQYQRLWWHRSLTHIGDRMFLEDAASFSYGDSTKLLTRSQAEHFFLRSIRPDGTGFTQERTNREPVEEREISLKEGHNLDHYWTPVPAFGDYSEVMLAGIEPADIDQALSEES